MLWLRTATTARAWGRNDAHSEGVARQSEATAMGCGDLHGGGVGLHSKGKAWEGNGVGLQSHGTA